MISYLDTSVVVAAVTREAKTARVRQWLQAQPPSALAVSAWVVIEIHSALSIKCRTGAITPAEHEGILAVAQELVDEGMEELPIVRGDFEVAARLAGAITLGLRAGDALHLAVATRHKARFITADRRLAEAAARLGIDAHLL